MAARRIAIVGGGLAGLVAARHLAARGEVTLFERDERLGGKLRTVSFRGRPLDLGPDAFIRRNRAAIDLSTELGLGPQLIEPASRSAAILARGELRPFPPGLAIGIPTDPRALAASGIVSRRAALRACSDLLRVRSVLDAEQPASLAAEDDPSVAQVLGGRFGRAVLETLVDPLIGGINASDVGSLSFAAALPQLVQPLRGAKSVMRALRPLAAPPTQNGTAAVFAGIEGGLAALSEALVADCAARGVQLRRGVGLASLRPQVSGSGWRVETAEGASDFDAVVLALPAPAAAGLVRDFSEELAAGLSAIPYAGVVTATFAFGRGAVPSRTTEHLRRSIKGGHDSPGAAVLPGSGVLVPRSAGYLLTAASFTSTKWPRSAAPGEIVIRASAGRHFDERAMELDDAALVRSLREDLARLLGISESPLEHVICRFPASFPQYVKGHTALVRELRRRAATLPPLVLTGAAYDGIGIPACIEGAIGQAAALDDALLR